MPSLMVAGLTNAVLASVLAVVVFPVTRVWRNPYLAHALWIIVLLKLITPPLVSVPFLIGSLERVIETSDASERARQSTDSISRVDAAPASSVAPGVSPLNAPSQPLEPPRRKDSARATDGEAAASLSLKSILAALWLTGSLIWASIVAGRVLRFQKVLRAADDPPFDVRNAVEAVRSRLDLRVRPGLRVVEGRLPPLVWPLGRVPTLVVPRSLLELLPADELNAILAHELAHVARRDHWVRWFELVVGLAYWWHPLLWLGRRELRAAEEACCDARVVECFATDGSQTYARALLKVVEFSSGLLNPRPTLASGIGTKSRLKRRIEMVLQNRTPRRLPVLMKLALVAVAVIVLPLSASAVQQDEPSPPSRRGAADETHDESPQDATLTEARSAPKDGEAREDVPNRDSRDDETSQSIRSRQRRVVAVPKEPYHIAPGDLLKIRVVGTLKEEPIDQTYLVEPSGKVPLGPMYGRVKVEGLSLEAAEEEILRHLRQILAEPKVLVTLGGWEESTSADALPRAIPSAAAHEMSSALLERLIQLASESQTTESIGVLKETAEFKQQQYVRIRELSDQNAVSRLEVDKAEFEYRLSTLRLRQAMRALRTRQLAVEVAEAQLQLARRTNQRNAGTIPDVEIRRLQLLVEIARARAAELAD